MEIAAVVKCHEKDFESIAMDFEGFVQMLIREFELEPDTDVCLEVSSKATQGTADFFIEGSLVATVTLNSHSTLDFAEPVSQYLH